MGNNRFSSPEERRDDNLRQIFDPEARPPETPAVKSYQEALDRFMSGNWLRDHEWGPGGVDERYVDGTWTKPQWAVQVNALMASGSYGKDNVQRAIREWLEKELPDTIALPATSQARQLFSALIMLRDGNGDKLDSSQISALSNGKRIFEDLAETRRHNPSAHSAELSSVLGQKDKNKGRHHGKDIIENMGAVAGGAYAAILLPELEPIFAAERQRNAEIMAALAGGYI